MRLFGQEFSRELLDRISSEVRAHPSLSRRELSRRVCGWMGWHDRQGRPREVSCRKALVELDRRGRVGLPAAQQVRNFQSQGQLTPAPSGIAQVHCDLSQLGPVEILAIEPGDRDTSAVWNGLMDQYHYLGRGPLCGAQIRYLVRSAAGWLGGLSFSAAAYRLHARDAWIGWSESARRMNLDKVVGNSRFLILSTVRVPNLASHVLARALHHLRSDWQQRYGYQPVLCETFVDAERFEGTCYQAANWIRVGQTAGREDGYSNGKVSTGPKEIFLFPLVRPWRSVLGREPESRLQLPEPAAPEQDWVQREFARVKIYDRRLRERLWGLTRDFFAHGGELVPQACGGCPAKTKGAYRFFENPRVTMKILLKSHVESTAGRMVESAVVLAVQDTTKLNYTAHGSTQGLGPINTQSDSAQGLILHDTLAFTPSGTPLGLLDAQCWARDAKEAGKRERRHQLPIEQKESQKWLNSYRATCRVQALCPQTTVVSVADREADLHELFHEAHTTPGGAHLLVRSERSRQRRVEDAEPERLWDLLAATPVAGSLEVNVPRRGSRPQRTAHLAVSHAAVTLKAPLRSQLPSVPIWAVYAREESPPPGSSPLEWFLLTTVEVTTFEHACERIDWYTQRWGIEVYHRILKSGCRIEDRRLHDSDRLETCLALDMVVAWKVFELTRLGREHPDLPCDTVLEEDQWRVLWVADRREPPPAQPPPLREAVRMIAKLGGFLGRKGDGEPGTTTVWRGLIRLHFLIEGFRYAEQLYRPRDGPGFLD